MRISTDNLTQENINGLSRTTRWRAGQRGWVRKPKVTNEDSSKINESLFYSDIKKEIGFIIRTYYIEVGWRVPSYMDANDLFQELYLHLVGLADHPGFASHKWRMRVLINRMRDFRKKGITESEAIATFLARRKLSDSSDFTWVDAMSKFIETQVTNKEYKEFDLYINSNGKLSIQLQNKLKQVFLNLTLASKK